MRHSVLPFLYSLLEDKAVMDLERQLQLRAAELSVADCSRDELMDALRYAWAGWLRERQQSECILEGHTGMKVKITGELLPRTLRAAVG